MLLSAHFTLAELTTTQHRELLAEQANPPDLVLAHLRHLCVTLLEPAREIVGPLHVNSGYRCPALNALIGGSKTSRHMDGLAADVVPLEMSLGEAYLHLSQANLPLDQLIFELGAWLHVGGVPADLEPRRQLLAMYRPGAYELWDPQDERFTRAV